MREVHVCRKTEEGKDNCFFAMRTNRLMLCSV